MNTKENKIPSPVHIVKVKLIKIPDLEQKYWVQTHLCKVFFLCY